MQIERNIGQAPRTKELVSEIASLRGPCVGCASCAGLCDELIEALVLPRLVLREKAA